MARILVVDDVKFISRVLSDLLGAQGHEIILAADGVEALETAITESPDLVLLDVTLPRMDGLEVARVLKSDPGTCGTPILVITARRDPETMKAAISAGVDDFLTKPFDDETLLARVAALLADKPEQEEASAAPDAGRAPDGLDALDDVCFVMADDAKSLAADLRRELDASERRTGGPVVIDLSGASDVGPDMANAIMALSQQAEESGRRIEVVRPKADDLRTRLAIARIARETPVHQDREAALASTRTSRGPDPL